MDFVTLLATGKLLRTLPREGSKSMRRHGWVLILIGTFALPASALASGFGVFTQGASGLGQANAVVAHSTGPSSAYFNPALLTQVSGTQLEVGITGIYGKREVKLDSTGETRDGKENWEFPGTFYLSHQVNDRLTTALAVFFPFGLSSEWDQDDFEGRYVGTYGEITTTNINPVVAVKVNEHISMAAGLSAVYFDAELKSMINQTAAGYLVNPPLGLGLLPDIEQKFTGDDWGVGYNAGLAAKLTDALTFGAAYRSEVRLEVEGQARLRGVDPLLAPLFPNSDGKTDVTLPQQVTSGLAYRFSDALVVEAGVRWEDWESTDELKIELATPIFGRSTQIGERDWHATWTYNVGGQYRVNETLALNLGYLYGKNAVPDRTVEVLIPDADAHLFTVGVEWANGPWTIAGALGYEHHESRRKHNDVKDEPGSAVASYAASTMAGYPVDVALGTANGDYKTEIYLVGLSVGYKF